MTAPANGDNISGNVVINGATLSHVGTHAITLTGSVNAQNPSVSFTVIIEDPCSAAVFQSTPAPADMPVTMPSVATTTQTVTVKTDIENLYSAIVCPITATLTPAPLYISLSGDYTTISVDAS